jgi:ABC-type sugar transport system substrate-binding protein
MRKILALAAAAAALTAASASADGFKLGIVAFQMSSETHARVANAAEAAAKAKGWEVTLLNSKGQLPDHAAQLENLVQSGVGGIILAMGKTVELDAQLAAAKQKGVPVITVMSGTSPHTLMDVAVDDFAAGAKIATYLLNRLNYRGGLLLERYEGNVSTRARGKVLDAVLSEHKAVAVLDAHVMARPQSWREDVKAGMEALTLKHQGKIDGVWASFDGQAFIIDDILRERGAKKGEIALVSVDGGQETFKRIRDPQSLMLASVAIPFEVLGQRAVDAMDAIAVKKTPKERIVAGPALMVETVLVDQTNVPAEGKWPW